MKKIIYILICVFFYTKLNYAQFTFVHITDLHIADGLSAGGYDLNGEMFKVVRDEINNLTLKPTFVVATGDISHAGDYGSAGMFPAFTQLLYPTGVVNPVVGSFFTDSLQTIPIYFIPGNHDFRYTNLPPLGSSITKYQNNLCSELDYFLIYQNVVIVCMNSGYDDLRSILEDSNYMSPESSGFTTEQLNWLRGVLNTHSSKRKIILMHSPPVNVVGTYCDGSVFSGSFVDFADGSIKYNRQEFLNICDSNKVDVVLAGHAHQNVVVTRTGVIVDENWTDSTRYVQTGAALNGCYRIISVDSNFVNVGYPQTAQQTSISQLYSSDFELYPNPSKGNLTIEIENPNNVLIIYNIVGEQVFYKYLNEKKTSLSLILNSGIYFYQIINNNNITSAGKLIIQK